MSAPKSVNLVPNSSTPPSLSAPFTITAPPGCDTWRAPPSSNRFTAPIVYHPIRLSSFRRARVTVSGPWRTLYDQGGLILVLPHSSGSSSSSDAPGQTSRRWIKSGVEVVAGTPYVSTVATDRWSDWSLTPAPAARAGANVTATIEFEREQGKAGAAPTTKMWVYLVHADGTRQPMREVTWVFADGDGEAWIGAYAAKPVADEEDKDHCIEVAFESWELETSE